MRLCTSWSPLLGIGCGPSFVRSSLQPFRKFWTRGSSACIAFSRSMPPPKQATLGYVRSSQSTLGKFFGGTTGVSAKPQQAKLAFSSNASKNGRTEGPDRNSDSVVETLIKKEEALDEEHIATEPAGGDMDDADVKAVQKGESASEPEEGDDRKPQSPSSTLPSKLPGRKRVVHSDHDEDVMSDEEPPTKKQRRKLVPKVTGSPAEIGEVPLKSERNGTATSKMSENVPVHKDTAAATTTTKPARKDSKDAKIKKAPLLVKQEADACPPNGVDDSPSRVKNTDGSNDRPDQSDVEPSEDEQAELSEEDKPEMAKKAREKVQATLSSNTKDLYPDWKPGEAVPYAALCTTFSKVEMTTKRLEIAAYCSLFLRQVLRLTPGDMLPTVLLMVNKLAADYSGIELGIGESLIMKAIGESTGRGLEKVKADQNEIGDLGLVAAKSRSNQPTMFKPKPLTVRGVHDGLMAIATIAGHGSQGNKIAGIKKLLSAADAHLAGKGSKGIDITKDKGGASEAKYIVRTLEGKMRLGLAEKTVLVALAQAMIMHESPKKVPSTEQLAKGEAMLKSVYNELPSYEVIVPIMLEHGIMNLPENCKLRPGVPLKPMLAKPTKSISEVLDRFEGKDFTCEYKYDGERAQIHFVAHDSTLEYATAIPAAGKSEKGISNIFSRNSEDLSKKYPDILAKLPTWVKDGTKSFVLDCETVGWDMIERKVLPFQQLMTRKRKDVKVEDVKIKVCVFAFDLLFLNGEALVNQSFRARRDLLYKAFNEVEGEFAFAKYGNTNELDEIQTLLEESVKASCEGLMVKMLDGVESNYEPSRRSQNWLKVKKDYLAGVGDSLDLVVLGAYYGKGKRTSVYGAFLLACYNPTAQTYETVCNIGTGFSEAVLEELHEQLSQIVIDKPKPFYTHSHGNKDQPDVWFEARQIWEVKTADLTLSPRYKAAASQLDATGEGKGISLRFPRFLKVRDDKKADDATTSRSVADMYKRQESVSKNKGPAADDDFEY